MRHPRPVTGARPFAGSGAGWRTAALLVAALTVLAGPPSTGPADAGPVLLSRLTACEPDRSILFVADDPDAPGPDTLLARPGAGELAWLGGPVRGMALGEEDTLYAATLLGVSVLDKGRAAAFLRWGDMAAGRPGLDPGLWPPLRRGSLPESLRAAVPVGDVKMLPERYHPLADGNLLFLVDAEQPPNGRRLLQDLHARDSRGREYLLARNLGVRTWVVAGDSLHWALAARVYRPDYGGQEAEVVLAGMGTRVETFERGPVAAMLWDDDPDLWVLLEDGVLLGIHPAEGAWRVRPAAPAVASTPCTPGPPESLWVWAAPGRYTDADAARLHGEAVHRRLSSGMAWVHALDDGRYRPVWGGFLSEKTLRRKIAEPPVPGARVRTVRVDTGETAGTAARLRVPALDGIAILRHVNRGDVIASELWWRFTSRPHEVRLAGPWGFEDPPESRRTRPSVDTHQREP